MDALGEVSGLAFHLGCEFQILARQGAQFDEVTRVLGESLPLVHQLAQLAEAPQQALSALWILPEVRIGSFLFELLDLLPLPGQVKDAPRYDRVARPALPDRQSSAVPYSTTSHGKSG